MLYLGMSLRTLLQVPNSAMFYLQSIYAQNLCAILEANLKYWPRISFF